MRPNIYKDVLQKPSTDFQAVYDGRTSTLKDFVLDLSVARTDASPVLINAPGNSFYIDANPNDGFVTVEFQDASRDNSTARLYCSPGAIFNMPFTFFKVTNILQPGKTVRIVYGVDIDFQPGSIAQIAVTNSGGFTAVRPEQLTGAFKSATAIGSASSEQIFAPGVNTNGIVLLAAQFFSANAGTAVQNNFQYGAVAPVALASQNVVFGSMFSGTAGATNGGGWLPNPILIPAGNGLWYFNTSAETTGSRSALWKAL